MANLSIENVINVSVSAVGQGAGAYNTSNLAIITSETPEASFGSDGYKIYLEPSDVATDFGSGSVTYAQALSVFSQQPNILAGGGYLVIIPLLETEEISEAVTRTESLVQYFGFIATDLSDEAAIIAAGSVAAVTSKIGFFGSRTAADLDATGKFDNIRLASLDKARCLFYGGADDLSVHKFVAAYAGRALSTNFNGSQTTQTMHLKDLAGILPDPTITQTLLTKAQDAGADCYISIQGVPKTFTSGGNKFFDDVYNLLWFVGSLKIAGFNVLATTSTKIAQTENGVSSLKSAYRRICEAAVTNEFVAAGRWTSANTFGVQEDFFDNITQRGYYIYSQPVALQLPSDRAERNAPLIQLAIKFSGAIHSSSVIVNINQ